MRSRVKGRRWGVLIGAKVLQPKDVASVAGGPTEQLGLGPGGHLVLAGQSLLQQLPQGSRLVARAPAPLGMSVSHGPVTIAIYVRKN